MICMVRYARLSVLIFLITSSLYGLSNKSIAVGLVGGACCWWYQHPQELKLDPSEMNIFTLFPSLDAGVESMRSYVTRFRNGEQLFLTQVVLSQKKSHSCAPKSVSVCDGISSGLTSYNQVVVYSNGNQRSSAMGMACAGLLGVYVRYRCGIISHLPAIAFDHSDDRFRYFNLGRIDEITYICQKIKEVSPDISKILMGECIGGMRMLKYAAHNPDDNIKALIGFSVMPSFDACLQGIRKTFLKPWGGDYLLRMPLLRFLHSHLFPSYKREQDNLFNYLGAIKDKDIFLAYHKRDIYLSVTDVQLLIEELNKKNRVYLVLVNGDEWAPHSAIETYHDSVLKALHAFYKKLDVPHDERLAQEGEPLLKQAFWAAQNVSHYLN